MKIFSVGEVVQIAIGLRKGQLAIVTAVDSSGGSFGPTYDIHMPPDHMWRSVLASSFAEVDPVVGAIWKAHHDLPSVLSSEQQTGKDTK